MKEKERKKCKKEHLKSELKTNALKEACMALFVRVCIISKYEGIKHPSCFSVQYVLTFSAVLTSLPLSALRDDLFATMQLEFLRWIIDPFSSSGVHKE
jgi:hypothetical protein